jgi:hypothetical protein
MELGKILEVTVITVDKWLMCKCFDGPTNVRIKRCFRKRVKCRQRWLVEIVGILTERAAYGFVKIIYLTRPIKRISK